jgi:transmembrane sensor
MSKQHSHINDDLLVKYLVDEATPTEAAEVEAWLTADIANTAHYAQLKRIWDESLALAAKSSVDEDAAYTRLQNRIKNMPADSGPQIVPLHPKKTNWLAIAASIIVLCTIGYFALDYFNDGSKLVTVASNNAVLADTLSDGTVVTLNKSSQLSYPQKFGNSLRSVSLRGEAFFNVTPDKTKPFIIKVNDVTIRVVGTSFNIKSRDGKTEVIVATGVVNVARSRDSINLNPGEKTEVGSNKARLSKQSIKGRLYSYYVNHELVCDQTPLAELVPALNSIYGAHIIIGNKALEQLPITTVFRDQSLEQVLMVVQETFKIKVERKNGQIILK